MQLIADGPDIPIAVLDGHARGRFDLFCGAGVSMRAGWSHFRRLVERVYEELGTACDSSEEAEWVAGSFDRRLELARRPLTRSAPLLSTKYFVLTTTKIFVDHAS
jgi:hypothetical protein